MDKITARNETGTKNKSELHHVIEEVDVAYQSLAGNSGSMNIDYAGFACMALGDFRDALDNPALSCDDLQAMLRAGMQQHKEADKKDDWSRLVASHVKRTANENA